ncbi:hypothetical protein G4B88_010387 [Cannabis sativa]|uniref:Ribulose bisphosphate carboxylase/oxygenase activase, chloroplastic n=1 Tax=Cannabis sativa TaxID=3483 RepID=A0A7J6I6Y7_CANSA|nr:hypothetical protein G4B88_010387 [Cannabis sativa]
MASMALCSSSPTFSFFPNSSTLPNTNKLSSFSLSCAPNSPPAAEDDAPKKKRLSKQSSWESKDSQGQDYLYRLGKEADNMNIAVGARSGVIDDLFAGNFLGRDSDIVFDYRQKVTKSFEYLQGDYYIAPLFMVVSSSSLHLYTNFNFPSCYRCYTYLHFHCCIGSYSSFLVDDKVVCHITKNYLAHILKTKVPLILAVVGAARGMVLERHYIGVNSPVALAEGSGNQTLLFEFCIWGGKGQGKSFQTELIFQAMGVEPVIMSAGELESERAGEPGKLIRERYRAASQVVQNQVRSFTTFTTPYVYVL